MHEESSFVTFTYADPELPPYENLDGSFEELFGFGA